MKLQRWEPTTRYIGTGEYVGDMETDVDGDFYLAADVDALLARIREAAKTERAKGLRLMELIDVWYCVRPEDKPPFAQAKARDAACSALDALLAGGGE